LGLGEKMTFGTQYSEFYNEIHKDKDYESECNQIVEILKSNGIGQHSRILDFGCGTGKHLERIVNEGYKCDGFDISKDMLFIARKSMPHSNFYSDINLIQDKYDLVYSLFDVLSYQVSDTEVRSFLSTLISLTSPGGRILFDSWHLEGLEKDPPSNRVKIFNANGKSFSRDVTVEKINGVRISKLNISILDIESGIKILTEEHIMRAFSKLELKSMVEELGGVDIEFFDGKEYRKRLSKDSWRMGVSFRTIENIA
jgi:SAM-dependent methyltransferase